MNSSALVSVIFAPTHDVPTHAMPVSESHSAQESSSIDLYHHAPFSNPEAIVSPHAAGLDGEDTKS